tara:strand:+ start:4251 stop:4841 length:591 start_codon:yes stop_codon:yes gene_type:complete
MSQDSIRKRPHYVNNKEFSQACVDYVREFRLAQSEGRDSPIVPNYIGGAFLKICDGLSTKVNFNRYTYREEMVMDAVENCLKAIMNYDIDTTTRTGLPNAFAYFTQIAFYAFLRRIAKEKKQQDIKWKYLDNADVEQLMHYDTSQLGEMHDSERQFIDYLRERIDKVRTQDTKVKDFVKKEKRIKKMSGLELFMGK